MLTICPQFDNFVSLVIAIEKENNRRKGIHMAEIHNNVLDVDEGISKIFSNHKMFAVEKFAT